MEEHLSYTKKYRCEWYDCAERCQKRAFNTRGEMMHFVNTECKPFRDRVKLFQRIDGEWKRFIIFRSVPIFYSDAKLILIELIH